MATGQEGIQFTGEHSMIKILRESTPAQAYFPWRIAEEIRIRVNFSLL